MEEPATPMFLLQIGKIDLTGLPRWMCDLMNLSAPEEWEKNEKGICYFLGINIPKNNFHSFEVKIIRET